ncbi:hypothetical protein ACMV8I_15600 [Ewingella sp. S1.OA.A_B6]
MKEIKLMADYQCHPLWGTTLEDFGDLSPEELPISLELKNSLGEWAKRYDALLNMDDPASSGFKSEEEAKLFIDDGYKLAERLQIELGSAYKITYHSNY